MFSNTNKCVTHVVRSWSTSCLNENHLVLTNRRRRSIVIILDHRHRYRLPPKRERVYHDPFRYSIPRQCCFYWLLVCREHMGGELVPIGITFKHI